MQRSMRASWPLFLTIAGACDSQAGPDYPGESMLSLVGSVTIEQDHTEGELVPALAFENSDSGRLDILHVQARGEFPASFSLDVYSPPPQVSRMQGPDGEPRFAIGYITAVTPDHPDTVPFASGEAEFGHCDEVACYVEFEACTGDDRACYKETRRCDENYENCEVIASSGDPSIRDDPWRSFAGLSANYQVLFLEADVAAGSELANEFGNGEALEAGYTLLEIRLPTQADKDAAYACEDQADHEVVAEYNQEHGTSYASIHDLGAPCQAEAAVCVPPPSEEEHEAWAHKVHQRRVELRCDSLNSIYHAVAHPETTSIEVRIARGVGPFAEEPSDE